MNKIFVEATQVSDNYIDIIDENDIKHLAKVLRSKVGDVLEVSDKSEFEYVAKIESLSEQSITLEILEKRAFSRESDVRITLYQGIPKASKMDSIIQKAVELGVFSIVPVFMKRTIVVDKGNFSKKTVRWQKISDEAVKQCKRDIVPEVCEAMRFDDMIDNLSSYDLVLFAYENEAKTSIKDVLTNADSSVKNIAVIVGPEGGFDKEEALAIIEARGNSVTLGKTILRTETAGMCAIAMIMYQMEL